MNTLYYGDNLKILRKYIAEESVDLIYLDPPFNSKRAYNVIFKDKTGSDASAQISAFEDTWHWSEETQEAFEQMIMKPQFPESLKQMLLAFNTYMGGTDLMAYLTMMAIRLVELHRVLKDTGSIYLHCDPTASHYLKILMDQIFGVNNFRNEITWCYTGPSGAKKDFPKKHDILLRYSKSGNWIFNANAIRIPYKELHTDKGKDSALWGTKGALQDEEVRKQYLERGKIPEDFWIDIPSGGHIPPQERLGFPTQKPEKLLERIIKASSNEGDVVLDPFCGCGTAVAAAEKLNRKWLGIDITHLAISLIKKRMHDHFPDVKFQVIGEPESYESAKELADANKFQFEAWAVSLLGGQPYKSKGGGDRGVDGLLYFKDYEGAFHRIIIQVKGGHYNLESVQRLKATMDDENAPLGVFLVLKPPSKGMLSYAASLGKWQMPGSEHKYPVMQILTVEDYFAGIRPELPDTSETLKKAKPETREQPKLEL